MEDLAAGWSQVLADADDSAWLIGAFVHLVKGGALDSAAVHVVSDEDLIAAEVLVSVGLLTRGQSGFSVAPAMAVEVGSGLVTRAQASVSSMRQLAAVMGIVGDTDGDGWAAYDDETLIAQGHASALGGTMLAMVVVPSLDGLEDRFNAGGAFLDVGVGIGALTAAFCAARATATVVGIDVLPRALALARETIATAGCQDRVELRLQRVEELADRQRFDLAWLPAPFIPTTVITNALTRLHDALRPGGWLVVGAGRFEGSPLSVAVTKWKTHRAGGTPLSHEDANNLFDTTGYVDFQQLPTPPGAPVLFAGRCR
jgi:SAM-dependent methyltransferase